MPGLFGILAKTARVSSDDLRSMARRMAIAMQRVPWLRTQIFGGDRFWGGRVHLGVLNPAPQPFMTETNVHVWFDGEVYRANGRSAATPAADEIQSWIYHPRRYLVEIDGIFSFAGFDPAATELFLGNDRFGFRPLYYTETADWFAYAAEVKALLAVLDHLPRLDDVALKQFFCFDHMFGERTWWRGIELLPPASVWKVSPEGQRKRRYWSFGDIQPDFRPVDDVVQEFKRLWQTAVQQRLRPGLMPVLLSGGLDSRLLLAELRQQGADVCAVTFGAEDCPDIRIASECAEIAGVPHHIRHINENNWWHGREDAIWQTDGLMNAVHFHEAIVREEMHTGGWISQKSNMADAIFHGKHVDAMMKDDWQKHPERLLGRRMLWSPFFEREEVLADSAEDARRYMAGPTVDGFFFLQNTRRLNLAGNLLLAPYCELLLPRASFPLLRLLLGALAPSERRGGKFYIRFLVENYPEYFRNTPWQSNGRGLKESELVRLLRNLRDESKRHAFNLSPRVPGIWRIASKLRPHYEYFVDYYDLLKLSEMTAKLLSKELLCDEILGGKARAVLSNPPADREKFVQTVTAVWTFETYLRQVQGLPCLGELRV